MKYLEKTFSVAGPGNKAKQCCEACVYGRGEHAEWCDYRYLKSDGERFRNTWKQLLTANHKIHTENRGWVLFKDIKDDDTINRVSVMDSIFTQSDNIKNTRVDPEELTGGIKKK